ncbi:C6 transcription factor asaR [Paramyrothecium foliicola]|nr:C6 transcription factor asaR [Paramyrothecium foliicola]
MAEMASRLSSLEKSVASAVDARSVTTPEHKNDSQLNIPSPETTSHSSATTEEVPKPRSGEDILVQHGSSSQYFNDILLSRVIGEEQNIESALTTPREAPSLQECSSPFNVLGILSAPNPLQPPHVFHPSKTLALKLWEIYSSNEDLCVCHKVLHRPTAEATIFGTIANPEKAPQDHLALCFSIYFSATESLRNSDTEPIPPTERRAHLLSFKSGVEQAFAYGDFLDCPSVIGLQALAIYLAALRLRNRGKGMWVLNGFALRIAQSLGLHRDGQQLGLPPFESEIRRRLWWLLVCRDGRAVEDYGLRDNSNASIVANVKMALNIEDCDFYPGITSLPPSRESWTPMTWSLLNAEISESMRELESAALRSTSSSPYNEDIRKQIMKELEAKLEKRFAKCNLVVPHQRFTVFCGRFLFRKLDFTTRQRWFILRNPNAHNKFATEENLKEAIDITEAGFFPDGDELLAKYAWCSKAYPQYHMALYILWHLCLRPEGPSVQQAWCSLQKIFNSLESYDVSFQGFGPKAIVLKALKTKAEAARRKVETRDTNYQTQQLATPEDTSPGLFPLGNPGDDWTNYSLLGFELQDWTTWTQGP